MPKAKSYAVAKGRKPGIYNTWTECQAQVKGFKGAVFKSFSSKQEAQQFVNSKSSNLASNTAKSTLPINATTQTNRSNINTTTTNKTKTGQRWYAVAKGHKPGIYTTWAECQAQTGKFSKPVFKKFSSRSDALDFMTLHTADNNNTSRKRPSPSSQQSIATDTTVTSTTAISNRPTKTLKIQIWFDGGARGNPGVAGSGAYLVISTITSGCSSSDSDSRGDAISQSSSKVRRTGSNTRSRSSGGSRIDSKLEAKIRHYCGSYCTNNFAEYTGLKEGLIQAKVHVDEFVAEIHKSRSSPTSNGNNSSSNDDYYYCIDLDIKGDSNLIMNQLCGQAVCRQPKLKVLNRECVKLMDGMKAHQKERRPCVLLPSYLSSSSTASSSSTSSNVQNDLNALEGDTEEYIFVTVKHGHVYREHNKVADALANEAMNSRKSWKTVLDVATATDASNDVTNSDNSKLEYDNWATESV